jgi:hypothetical protein
MAGFHSAGIKTETRTSDGQPVSWIVDPTVHTVTVFVAGVPLGTFKSRSAAREALGLVEVRVK